MAGSPVCLACRGQVSRPSPLVPSPTRPSGPAMWRPHRVLPGPGSENRLASFVLTIVFPRGATRGCASHSAWWPSGMGSIYVHPLGRARHRTRSSPDRRSGCVRCIGADASDPFEVVPLAQSAQLRVLRTAVGNAGAAVVRGVEETCRRHRPSSAHPRPSPMSSGGTTVLSEGT